MAERRIQHLFNCSIDTYWQKIFFDADYNTGLFLGELKFHSWKQIAFQETDTEILRTIEAVPRIGDLPGPLKKLISDGASYREHGVFNKTTRAYRVDVTPSVLSDRLSIHGLTTAEPVSERQFRRVYSGTVNANIFAVGGLIERRILDDLDKSYALAAVFTNRWITEHGL